MSSRSTLCELHKSKLQAIILFIFHLIVISADEKNTSRDLEYSMKFNFALFHFNKCYHHRLEWKKFMKTKSSVPISSRSTIQLMGTMWRKIFAQSADRERGNCVHKIGKSALIEVVAGKLANVLEIWRLENLLFLVSARARESLMTHATFQPFSWISRRDTK